MALAHDSGYRHLFSHALMIEHLLRGFVPQAWVNDIDFASLQPWRGDHVADDLTERRQDLVWRVRLRGEHWLYVYLLMEFQSRSDPWMGLRMLSYVALLYQNLIKQDKAVRPGELPAVFPLVVHHGAQPWSAPRELAPLFCRTPHALAAYHPRLRYFVLDEHQAGAAATQDNVVAHLIALERSTTPAQVRSSIMALRRCLTASRHDGLRRAFAVYIHRVVLRRLVRHADIPEVNDLQELDAMLAERVEEWTRNWERQGLEKGRLQGLQEGREEGREAGREEGRRQALQQALQLILETRFGSLPAWAGASVAQANTDRLVAWTQAAVLAPTIEAVFDDGAARGGQASGKPIP